jgi:hypothetical protein
MGYVIVALIALIVGFAGGEYFTSAKLKALVAKYETFLKTYLTNLEGEAKAEAEKLLSELEIDWKNLESKL